MTLGEVASFAEGSSRRGTQPGNELLGPEERSGWHTSVHHSSY